MNWINSFEIICYFIVTILVIDILKNKNYRELCLLISGAIAGFSLELLAVRLTDIYHYSNDFYISIGFVPYQFPFFGGLIKLEILQIVHAYGVFVFMLFVMTLLLALVDVKESDDFRK
ncbi:hypothetical protein [Peptoniphilus sp.]|uniref:hypothetical protein n=1 Tax=Peptoniphilus sp. TaxID=1971214 RepID=UPI0039933131